MFGILDRYIGRVIFMSILLCELTLVGLAALIKYVEQLKAVGEGNYDMLNALYYDKGYLSVQVATPRVMLTPDRNGIEITISINEGPRYKIRSLRVFERDADGTGGEIHVPHATASTDGGRRAWRSTTPGAGQRRGNPSPR